IISVQRKSESVHLVTKRKVYAVRCFFYKIFVADLEHQIADVRAVVIEFFERRSTRRERIIRDRRTAFPKPDIYSRTTRKACKAPRTKVHVFRIVAMIFDACTELKFHTAEVYV